MFCIGCAEKLYDGAKFCHQCGTAVPGKEGEQSLLSLKEKFNIFKEKSLKKKNVVHKGSRLPESSSHNLGVQILDRNYKAVKRVFQGPSGFTGIIRILVNGASTGKTWKELVQKKFRHCKLAVCRYGEGVFNKCVNEDEYTISDLQEEKRKKTSEGTQMFHGGGGKRLCLQFVYIPLIQNHLGEVVEMWNSHNIRRQKMGDVINGIPDILFSNPEITGAEDCLSPTTEEIQDLRELCQNNCTELDPDFIRIVQDVTETYQIPNAAEDFATARNLFIVLSEVITKLYHQM